jgi:short-subunit dehydrogenase
VAAVEVRDQVILVTGAAGGMGRALCMRLGREGAHLGLVDRDEGALRQVQVALERAGVRCAAAPADVRRRDELRTAIDTVTKALAPVDVLVAAAGVCAISTADELRVPLLEEMLQVNFLGVVFAIEAVLPGMLDRRHGQIVALVSLSAVCPLPFENGYSASKAALAAYLQSLRPPLRRRGVEVTSVFPGIIRTPLLQRLLDESGARPPSGSMGAEEAADEIFTAIRRGRGVAFFPRRVCWPARLAGSLPPRAYDWVMTRLAVSMNLPH